MTVGMTPTRPETGFGYLHCGRRVGDSPVLEVLQFKEKPTHEVARKFVDSGEYLWNASMFLWRVEVFLAELERQQAELHAGVTRIAAAWDGPDRADVLSDVWPTLPKIAVDYAVMEDAAARGRVATVPADFGWADVGDFRNLGELLDADDQGNVVVTASPTAPTPVLSETSGSVVAVEDGRLVALLGLHDVIVIDTPDALLVCARDRAQDVKKLVDELKARGATEYL
jgi:mannose-1-phosphate guanylyltransferase